MKRGLVFTIIFLILLLNITETKTSEITGDAIIGESITGEVTQIFGINITVVGPPILTITNPKNHTYITNISRPLTFDVVDEDNIWYNLDNGVNITITNSISFNTSIGSHTLYLFANNSNGETTKNVVFFINLTRFIIIYDEFNGSLKGETPDLYNFSYEDLQNMTDLILENAENGKIKYNVIINITDDENITDNQLDLDSNVNISFNRIEINSTALPNFNKTVTLSLYNLTFSNPRILRDGSICTSDICVKESYTNGILIFNVTEFSIYSAEETPVVFSPPGGGSGGLRPAKDFSIDKEKITISFKVNESIKKETITLKNIGDINLRMNLENKFEKFLVLDETNFLLSRGDSKTISLVFIKNENIVPGVYTGEIIVEGGGKIREILIVLEVESIEPLFDVVLTIPEKFWIINQGENLVLESDIINLGGPIEGKLSVNYIIKDLENNIIVMDKDFVSIKDRLSLTKEIRLPKSISSGNYVAIVEVIYQDLKVVSSRFFQVRALEYILLEFNYRNGEFDLIEGTLEEGYSPTISHDSNKKYRFNLRSSDEEILYALPIDDPGAFFSELFVQDEIKGGLKEFELEGSFYIVAPEKRESENFQILLRNYLDDGPDSVVAEGNVYDIGAKSCRIR